VENPRKSAKTTQLVCPVLQVRNIDVCAVLVLRAKTAKTVGIKDIFSRNKKNKKTSYLVGTFKQAKRYYYAKNDFPCVTTPKTQRVLLSTHSSLALRSGYE